MTRIFADSYFFFALLNPRDPAHERVVEFSRRSNNPLATTAWIFTELADGLASTPRRPTFRRVLKDFEANHANLFVPANMETYEKGVDLYHTRPDKKWSLTDCISFVVMKEEGIVDALTGDHHFEQAGFKVLFK